MEATLYLYVFAPDTSQLRGRHRLCPGGLATVIRQVLALLELVSTANSPGSGSQTSPLLFLLLYVNVDASKACFQASPLPILSPQLTTAAGNYA
jgi:hypothetical protein